MGDRVAAEARLEVFRHPLAVDRSRRLGIRARRNSGRSLFGDRQCLQQLGEHAAGGEEALLGRIGKRLEDPRDFLAGPGFRERRVGFVQQGSRLAAKVIDEWPRLRRALLSTQVVCGPTGGAGEVP
jgi:hypothetical protein